MRNAEKFTDKALKAVERIARNEVEKIVFGKTTGCATIWHQPKRPKTK
ncbi:MAG: cyclic lactone autoinducer peptide [Lachnospiraceae bacterium]|nr:cyclic lactone autoinducer peptide [Lachnospiraceae bacterium]